MKEENSSIIYSPPLFIHYFILDEVIHSSDKSKLEISMTINNDSHPILFSIGRIYKTYRICLYLKAIIVYCPQGNSLILIK